MDKRCFDFEAELQDLAAYFNGWQELSEEEEEDKNNLWRYQNKLKLLVIILFEWLIHGIVTSAACWVQMYELCGGARSQWEMLSLWMPG